MSKLTPLVGKRFGLLYVMQKVNKKDTQGRPFYRCQCDCGTRVTVGHYRLIGPNPKTHCGCKIKKHPQHSATYHAWWDARGRCMDEKHPSYPSYGAKGIRMCQEWCDSFEVFLQAVGYRPDKRHSLDRIDAHGHYEPGNVRWATLKIQARNKKNTKWVRHPETKVWIRAADLAEALGMSYQSMRAMMIEKGLWDEKLEDGQT